MSQQTGRTATPASVGGVDGMIVMSGAQDASDADIAAFRQAPAADPNDLAPNHPMLGEDYRHAVSARHDTRTKGFTTDERNFAPPQFEDNRASEPDFIGDTFLPEAPPQPDEQQPAAPPDANWQQRYGQSENEKGEWRRLAEQTAAQLAETQNRLAAIELRAMRPGYVPQVAPQPVAPLNLFGERSPEDVLTVDDMNRIVNGEIIPAFAQVRDEAYQRAVADMQRQPQMGWDVTPAEEVAIRNRFPSIARMPLQEQNQFILEHARATRPAASENPAAVQTPVPATRPHMTPVPPRVQVVNPNSVIQRQTFVESAGPVSAPPDTSASLSPEQKAAREIHALDAQYRSRGMGQAPASAVRDVLIKHGVRQVNDFGGQALTR